MNTERLGRYVRTLLESLVTLIEEECYHHDPKYIDEIIDIYVSGFAKVLRAFGEQYFSNYRAVPRQRGEASTAFRRQQEPYIFEGRVAPSHTTGDVCTSWV